MIRMKSGKDPRNAPEEPRHEKVKVYFIGDFMYTQKDPKTGKPVPHEIVISADGRHPFIMPEVGGFIEVEAHVANRLIRNSRMPYPQNHPLHGKAMQAAMTLDGEYAALKAKAFKSGRPMEAVVASENVSKLSREELLAELARRDAEQPVYQDGKVRREEPSGEVPVKYQDETPEAQAEHAEEVVYQDEADEGVKKGPGRPKKSEG